MRVSTSDLQAVRGQEMLVRYAVLGPVAFVLVDLPPGGTRGTSIEEACLLEHHGFVLDGELSVVVDGTAGEDFGRGTAFYVPAGPPSHHFVGSPGAVVAGFAQVTEPIDDTPETLAARGFEVVGRPPRPMPFPPIVHVRGGERPVTRRGAIEVEGRVMGPWFFMRSVFGTESGFTSSWCDVPHWGLVLDGAVSISSRTTDELVTAGDVYYIDSEHRFEAADAATIIDYTPLADLSSRRLATWRRAVLAKTGVGPEPEPVAGGRRA